MAAEPTVEAIRQVAKELDDALETKEVERILPFFAEDCEIELLGAKVTGREGAKRWLMWQFGHVATVRLVPVVIMIECDTFFEEFIVQATLHDGTQVESRQAEVLVYDRDLKVKSLRLYFDRLDFADALAKDVISRAIVRKVIARSLKGLV